MSYKASLILSEHLVLIMCPCLSSLSLFCLYLSLFLSVSVFLCLCLLLSVEVCPYMCLFVNIFYVPTTHMFKTGTQNGGWQLNSILDELDMKDSKPFFYLFYKSGFRSLNPTERCLSKLMTGRLQSHAHNIRQLCTADKEK